MVGLAPAGLVGQPHYKGGSQRSALGRERGGEGGKGREGGEGGTYSEDHFVSDAHILRVPRAAAGVNERREGVPPSFAMRNINGTRVTAAKQKGLRALARNQYKKGAR